ncbi:enoyl-CoA hydratase [Rhodococcus sp. SRB_17]|uniref:MaoC family dehydratase n=1 Tax=Rhodococcus sp. OK302 TaxID=1882769 RepID=UPI000B93C02A|nr:MaoC family dehydratase [Rhodococcus sp. OK302]NMM86342.1 enoyl-CoA hydratase [Rhodococcus sp. SRB_17]OYD69759.1 acyl dehydratase [Rhodococcus sp. OK302]
MTELKPKTVALCDMPELAGANLGTSDYTQITQQQINLFADATNDHQWLHVDPERAKDGPFGTTIAHGFLTLSYAPSLFFTLLDVSGTDQVINCGIDKARFTAPVPVDSHLALSADITTVEPCRGGYQVKAELTFSVENSERPVCVAEMIVRYLGRIDA